MEIEEENEEDFNEVQEFEEEENDPNHKKLKDELKDLDEMEAYLDNKAEGLLDSDREDSEEENEEREEKDEINDEEVENDVFDQAREEILKLENELLEEKSWQYKGEISATKRPKNSLVNEELIFKTGFQKPAEITVSIEVQLARIY